MKLLLAYDGSADAEAALEDLASAGLGPGVNALVLSVADVWLPPDGDEEPETLPEGVATARRHARDALDEARALAGEGARHLRARYPSWEVREEAIADSPAWGIVKRAEAEAVDLVAMGSRGQSGVERVLIGSVSSTVAREANTSVRVVRPPEKRLAGASAPRLLIAVDGSEGAEAALTRIAGGRWPAGTTARVVAVRDRSLSTSILASLPGASRLWSRASTASEATTGEQGWVERMLEEAAARLRGAGLEVESALLHGEPRHEIVDEAERWGAGTVYLGARGLGRVERALLGSVSSTVLAHAPCSVEIVR